ncbi:hypothetical protein BpHYR1_038162 [Brachionus plicatilis]|uniref:Uncharacterized protein n=1 Tax=Brachionus plicatilis TaxID=10195 RepID=A0A3M7Q230_BRAPC|nr:hypothetical protein BpHYR1_038162 [Brachionus plicatilis]
MVKGLGPFVNLLINNGKTISNGVRGIAKSPKLSLDTPFSISFTLLVRSKSVSFLTLGKETI